MRPLARLALAAGLLLTFGAMAARAQSFPDAQRSEIEKIVREYLIQHPEVLQDAMSALEKKQAADEALKNKAAIKDNAEYKAAKVGQWTAARGDLVAELLKIPAVQRMKAGP